MCKEHFLTIGQLSRLSNVHTKALRYYEKIGILTPSKINSDTGYRYYSYAHIPYVKMIKLCANYEIPLQTFRNFVKDKNTIDLKKLLELAESKIQQKLVNTQADYSQIQDLRKRLDQSKAIDQVGKIDYDEKHQVFWLLPFDGEIFDQNYYKLVAQALTDLEAVKCQTQHKIGLYYDLRGDKPSPYLSFQIIGYHKFPDVGRRLELPETSYTSHHIQQEDIPKLLETLPSNYCFIWETYEQDYLLSKPDLEITYPKIY